MSRHSGLGLGTGSHGMHANLIMYMHTMRRCFRSTLLYFSLYLALLYRFPTDMAPVRLPPLAMKLGSSGDRHIMLLAGTWPARPGTIKSYTGRLVGEGWALIGQYRRPERRSGREPAIQVHRLVAYRSLLISHYLNFSLLICSGLQSEVWWSVSDRITDKACCKDACRVSMRARGMELA